MRPDANSPSPSPFSGIPEAEWLCANELAFAILDSFPVSPGHVLVITRRVVPTYFDCTAAEQGAVMVLVGEVKRLLDERLDPKPDGYNVGFNAGAAAGQTVPHVHVHVTPRYAGDMPDPRGGVRHVIPGKGNYLAESRPVAPQRGEKGDSHHFRQVDGRGSALRENGGCHLFLTTGPDRPLWQRLADRLPGASEIDLLASFVQTSGLDHVREGLFSAIATGARIRLLVGDYLGITSPDALRLLVGWMESSGTAFEAQLVELEKLRGKRCQPPFSDPGPGGEVSGVSRGPRVPPPRHRRRRHGAAGGDVAAEVGIELAEVPDLDLDAGAGGPELVRD
ncbi:MAG: HIT domain-containing protein [Planctomycetota bacterium]